MKKTLFLAGTVILGLIVGWTITEVWINFSNAPVSLQIGVLLAGAITCFHSALSEEKNAQAVQNKIVYDRLKNNT